MTADPNEHPPPHQISRRTAVLAGAASAAVLVGCTSSGSRESAGGPNIAGQVPPEQVATAGRKGFADVRDYGAVGDGLADDTDAIQKAIDACIGPGDPASTPRRAIRALYFSPGQYKVTAPLKITSVQGFYLTGAGVQVTSLLPVAGKAFDSLLDINGCSEGWFGNFGVNAGGQTCNVDKVINYHWDKEVAARSSSGCTFSNISIREVTFRIGFAIGSDNHLQVDGTSFYSCGVGGQFEPGSSNDKTFQYGFKFGDGVSGNNLDHVLYNSAPAHCRFGVWFGGANGWAYGGQPTDNDIDYHIEQPSVFSIQGMRSEGARRFLSTGGGSAGGLIAIRDVLFVGNRIHDDGAWIDCSMPGALTLESVGTYNIASGQAKIRATAKAQVVLTNVVQPTPIADGLVASGGAKFVVVSYSQSNKDGQLVSSAQFVTKP